jgi:mannan endo-1,4-beta-mannosidase
VTPLAVRGRDIVDATGRPIILRGANVMHAEWAGHLEWERRAIPEFATNWNASVLIRGFASDPVNRGDPAYLSQLDELVDLSETHNLYLVLAWRSHVVNGPQPPQPDAAARTALAALAGRYRSRPHVVYALQVEPHTQNLTLVRWARLRPMFETMVDEIRAASAPFEPLVMIPGTDWSRDLRGAIDDPVDRPNVVYKTHPYNPSRDFQALFGRAHDAGLPVFVAEFAPANPQQHTHMTMDDVRDLLAFTRARRIGWAAWLLDYETHSLMNEEDLTPTSPYGEAVRAELLAGHA